MVSLNFFKLFKRKKEPKNTPVNAKNNDTKPSADATTNIGKVDEVFTKLQVEQPNSLQQVNLKEKEEVSRQLSEQASEQLNKKHRELDVVEPVDVEQQGHLKVVEDRPVINEVTVPDGTSVTEEIKEAESTPVVIDQSNAPADTGIIEQETSNEILESRGGTTEHVEIPDKADEDKFETSRSIEQVEPAEKIDIPAETKKHSLESDRTVEPVEANEHVEIPVETVKSLEQVEPTENIEIPAKTNQVKVETDKSIEPAEATKPVETPVATDKSLEPIEALELVEIPTETKEAKVETDKSLEPVEPIDPLFKEFLKNAENSVFPNEQSKEIFKSYNDGEINEAAAIILLKEAEGKAKPKTGNTNNKKNKKNNNKKKGKKGKKK